MFIYCIANKYFSITCHEFVRLSRCGDNKVEWLDVRERIGCCWWLNQKALSSLSLCLRWHPNPPQQPCRCCAAFRPLRRLSAHAAAPLYSPWCLYKETVDQCFMGSTSAVTQPLWGAHLQHKDLLRLSLCQHCAAASFFSSIMTTD